MHAPFELKEALDKAKNHYQEALNDLNGREHDDLSWQRAAQRANDAYLEWKKIDSAVTNCLIIKKLGDLYGCH